MGVAGSRFITHRMYDADGTELWNADHGQNVNAVAVDSSGNVYTVGEYDPATYVTGPYFLLKKYSSSGALVWSVSITDGAHDYYGTGVAVTSTGAVYVSRWAPLINAEIVKYDSAGSKIGRVQDSVFFSPAGTSRYTTLRVGPSDELIALGRDYTDQGVYKWVGDEEDWQFFNYGAASSGHVATWSGLTVDSDGNVSMGKRHTGATGTIPTTVYDSIGPETGHATVTGFDTRAAYQPKTTSDNVVAVAAMSTSVVLAKQVNFGHKVITFTNYGAVNSLTPPIVTQLLAGSEFDTLNQPALAANSSGTFCVGVSRSLAGHTHRVYQHPDTLLWSADHRGGVRDCVVLPDGKVVIAGLRVAKVSGH